MLLRLDSWESGKVRTNFAARQIGAIKTLCWAGYYMNSISSFAIEATIVQPVHESDAQRYQVDGEIKKYCGGSIPSRN